MRRAGILVPFDNTVSDEARKVLSREYRVLRQRMLALHKETPGLCFDELFVAVDMTEEDNMDVI